MSAPSAGQVIAELAGALGILQAKARARLGSRAQATSVNRARRLELALRWALGESPEGLPDWPDPKEGGGAFYWRSRLSVLADLENSLDGPDEFEKEVEAIASNALRGVTHR